MMVEPMNNIFISLGFLVSLFFFFFKSTIYIPLHTEYMRGIDTSTNNLVKNRQMSVCFLMSDWRGFIVLIVTM